MNKFLLTACLVGTVSSISAASDAANHEEPVSPAGRHGTKSGGMSSKVFKSSDDVLTTTFPSIVLVKRLASDRETILESTIHISRTDRVVDFKAGLISGCRIPSAHRLELNGVEVMKDNVGPDGALITLAEIFTGISGVPTLEVIVDLGRSPMLTPAPQPVEEGKISPMSKLPDAE